MNNILHLTIIIKIKLLHYLKTDLIYLEGENRFIVKISILLIKKEFYSTQ